MQDYLSNYKKRTKINSVYSLWEEILFGNPQGIRTYVIGTSIEDVIFKLQSASKIPTFNGLCITK